MKKNVVSQETKREVTELIKARHATAAKAEKSRLLDEFIRLTGYHRKHAIRVLRSDDLSARSSLPRGKRIYDEAVREALIVVWEAADRICGKRLKGVMPQFVEALEAHGRLQLACEVRERLLSASAATIDRLLSPIRQETRSRKSRRSSNQTNKKVPVRTFSDWEEPQPGFFEIDFVAHCGGSMAGVFLHSLVMTDVCSGWTEALPLLAREQTLVAEGLEVLGRQTPVPVLGIDADNDSAFLNETLLSYCEERQIEFTRCRPYRKNDQAWIEQKNGAVIRRFVGYDRFAGTVAGQALAHLYHSVRLFVNYFQPSFKLKEKVRHGSKIKKKYFPPATPCDRLLAETRVSAGAKEALRNERSQLDPVELLHRIRTAQSALASLAGGNTEGEGQVSLDEFLDQLPHLWESGEARPTHRKQSSRPRDWRTRKDPFEGVWFKVLGWLEKDPDASAKALFDQLRLEHPGEFQDGQLRTLQRRVRQWRQIMAKTLVYSCLSEGAHPVRATVVGEREGAEVEAASS